jgi:hypothetical protein
MEDELLLKEYYYDHVDPDRSRDFDKLTIEEKTMIRGMWGFAFFRADKALKAAKQACSDALPWN